MEKRVVAYRTLLDEAIDETTLAEIRDYLQQQRAPGYDAFRMMVEAKTQRFAGTRPPIDHANKKARPLK